VYSIRRRLNRIKTVALVDRAIASTILARGCNPPSGPRSPNPPGSRAVSLLGFFGLTGSSAVEVGGWCAGRKLRLYLTPALLNRPPKVLIAPRSDHRFCRYLAHARRCSSANVLTVNELVSAGPCFVIIRENG